MITDFFNSTVEVRQAATATTGMGGVRTTFSTRIISLPCRITRKAGLARTHTITETEEFGKMTTRAIWRLYCEANSDGLSIQPTDRIVLGSGTELQVKTIYNPGQLNRHLEIDCLELD